MSSPGKPQRQGVRRRSSSVTQALNQIPLNHQERQGNGQTPSPTEVKPLSGPTRPRKTAESDLPDMYRSKGFLEDLKTGRWMLIPSSAFKLMLVPVVLYWNHRLLQHYGVFSQGTPNPFEPLLWPSYELPNGLFEKGLKDWLFVFNHVIFWSFVRQFVTLNILRPMAKAFGLKKSKLFRFLEQGYAVVYFGIMGTVGLIVMHGLPTWFFNTKYFWIDYPHRQMTFGLKVYYLLQASYWVQQSILLAARIEKPRKDFKELVAHHIVTLWLIGWSYSFNLTYIGNAVFVSMDVSDIFLALSKCVNYVNETASVPIFAGFVFIWNYFRNYQNLCILLSVWYEWFLIPEKNRQVFKPFPDRQYMPPWMRYQIFAPILLLLFINLFWTFLIMRILWRAVSGATVKDDRSDDEDEEPSTEKKVKSVTKGDKAK